jgi:uncharacterized coiled-coil DUF342 family protein
MSIVELKDMSHKYSPAPEIPTSLMEILAQEALDLFEEAEGFHFRDYDEVAEQIEHVEAEMGKGRKELDSLREEAAKVAKA